LSSWCERIGEPELFDVRFDDADFEEQPQSGLEEADDGFGQVVLSLNQVVLGFADVTDFAATGLEEDGAGGEAPFGGGQGGLTADDIEALLVRGCGGCRRCLV
jgi:hypothetical protein